MSKRDAAPLTARLLDSKRRTGARDSSAKPKSGQSQSSDTASGEASPHVRTPQDTPPTVHTVDLTPPDFLRATAFGLPPPAQKRHE